MSTARSYNITFKRRDDEFERFLEEVQFDATNKELTPERAKERREAAKTSRAAFCHEYFDNVFYLPDNKLHTRLDDLVDNIWHVIGHRESGKTARVIVGHVIRDIVLKNRKNICIVSRTKEKSQDRLAQILRVLKANKKLNYDFQLKYQKEADKHLLVNDVHVYAATVQTDLRAMLSDDFQRIDLLIGDDFTGALSGQADKTKAVTFIESEEPGQLTKDGLAINLYNATEPDSPGAVMMKKSPERSIVFPAVVDDNGEANLGGVSNWPEYRSTEEWAEFFKDKAYTTIMGDYQCQPVLNGENFKIEWLKTVNINLHKILASVTAIDPSYGTSPQSCLKGVVTLGWVDKEKFDVIDIWLRTDDYYAMFDHIDRNRSRWPKWKTCLFENDFNQWKIAEPYYQQWKVKRNTTLPIMPYSAKELKTDKFGTDKESRILNLVMPHQSGQIFYNAELDGSKDFEIFKAQYIGFGADREKKDGLDALATAFIMLPRWVETGTFKAIKERTFAGGLSFLRRRM